MVLASVADMMLMPKSYLDKEEAHRPIFFQNMSKLEETFPLFFQIHPQGLS